MNIMRKIFRENLGIKIAAILLSLLVFFYVRTQREGEITFRVPVQLVGLPDSLTWTGELPDQVSVTFSGKIRNLIRLRLGSLRIPVDVSGAEVGRFQRTLSAADVPTPEGSLVAISHFPGPDRIDIMIEKKISKAVRVAPLLVGTLIEGFALTAPPVAVPDTVTIYGAASAVTATDSLFTRPVDISQRRQSFSARVRLDLQERVFKSTTQVVEVFVSVGAESLGLKQDSPTAASQR